MHRITLICFLLFLTSIAWGQAVLRGMVTDTTGEPLAFASVYIQGTSRGTTTNADGAYAIDLSPGAYKMVYQYVGYESKVETVVLNPSGKVLNVTLRETLVELSAVEVIANREDPAYAIIRKAQARRTYYLNQVKEYAANVYIKGAFVIKKTPEKLFGREIGDMDGMVDTTGKGYLYLSESVSKLYYQAPNNKKEVMISSKVSGDPQGFSFNRANTMDFNFYENHIQLYRAMVSPISSSAMDHYRFRLEGVSFDSDGRMVNKIAIIPKRKQEPVFEGHIFITDDLWNIHELDVWSTGASLKQPVIDTFRIKQLNVPIAGSEGLAWMMFHQKLELNINLFGFKFDGIFSAIFSDYNLNPQFEKGFFNREVLLIEDEANKRDSIYWQDIRPIPLTQREIKDYIKKDSIRKVKDSPEYLDSLDRVGNRLSVDFLLTGYTYRVRKKQFSIGYNSPLMFLSFNPVQGYGGALDLFARKGFGNNSGKSLDVNFKMQYGLKERRGNPDISATYKWDRIHKQVISGGWSRNLQPYDPASPIIGVAAVYANLFFKEHYLKLYRRERAFLSYQRDIINGLKLTLSSDWTSRNPVANKTNHSYADKEQLYPENMPLELPLDAFPPDEQVSVGVTVDWQPGARYVSLPERRINIGSDYPLVTMNYERSIPTNSLGADWERWRISVRKDRIQTGYLGYSLAHLQAGLFSRSENVPWPDRFHFNGNEILWISSAKYMEGFLNLPYFERSSDGPYASIHYEHHFDGVLLDRIPLINKLGWKTVVGYSRLQQEAGMDWNEVLFGFEHIGISLYRGIRVNLVGSWGQEVPWDLGFRFSLLGGFGMF
jgi:hypothetical protein